MPTFTPPLVTEHRPARDPFWFATQDRGLTVLREAGVWTVVDCPTDDRVQAAERAYRGGYVYTVTQDEADELTAAGFGSGVSA